MMNGRIIKINRIPFGIASLVVICVLIYLFSGTEEDNERQFYGIWRNGSKVNLRKLLIGAIQAAKHGGLEIVAVAQSLDLNERSKGKTDEGANDPYTAADVNSHCVMKQGLKRIFPRINIVSEEDKEACPELHTFDLDPTVLQESADVTDELVDANDLTVWIDPLDATQEFTEQLYEYVTTMVCVAIKGKPIIGVIHNPFSGKTAWAWVDHATSEYLQAIYPHASQMQQTIITVSRSHAGHAKDLIRNVFGEEAKILIAAGAGYKVLQVVANNATAYLHSTKIKKWDLCAGNAILRAFGGVMTTLDNQLIDYKANDDPVNTHGVLATITNHRFYIDKLKQHTNIQAEKNHHQR